MRLRLPLLLAGGGRPRPPPPPLLLKLWCRVGVSAPLTERVMEALGVDRREEEEASASGKNVGFAKNVT